VQYCAALPEGEEALLDKRLEPNVVGVAFAKSQRIELVR
jgi:hypothetical protein